LGKPGSYFGYSLAVHENSAEKRYFSRNNFARMETITGRKLNEFIIKGFSWGHQKIAMLTVPVSQVRCTNAKKMG
jgi:hypothetical protein